MSVKTNKRSPGGGDGDGGFLSGDVGAFNLSSNGGARSPMSSEYGVIRSPQQLYHNQQQSGQQHSNTINTSSNSKSYHFLFKVCLVGDNGVGKSKLLRAEDKVSPDFGTSVYNSTAAGSSVISSIGRNGNIPNAVGSSNNNAGRSNAAAAGAKAAQQPESEYEGFPSGFPSVGFKVRDYYFNDCTYRLQFWDCPGSDRYMRLTTKYCSGVTGLVLVFDLTNAKSFEKMRAWHEAMDEVAQEVPKILVGNKDNCLSSPRQVPRSLAENYAKDHDMHYYETDALSHIRCDAVFKDLFMQMVEGVPPGADPKDLLNKGVKLGPLLLSSKHYKQSLLSQTVDANATSFSMDWL